MSDEIGRALQKVGGTAGALGVEYEKLATWIAVVSSRTRESAEAIGTSFSTILARFTSLKERGFDEEDGTKINEVAKALSQVGIQLLDSTGNFNDIGNIIDKLGKKWETLDSRTRAYLATTVAGTRQQSRFYNLMEGYSEVTDLYTKSLEASGSLQNKFTIWQESTAAKMDALTASWEGFWQNSIDSSLIKGILSFLKDLVEGLDNAGRTITLVSGLFIAFKSKAIIDFVIGIGTSIKALFALKTAAEGTAVALSFTQKALGVFGLITAGITALIVVIDSLSSKQEKLNKQIEENIQKYQQQKSAVDSLISSYKQNVELAKTDESAKDSLIDIQAELITMFGSSAEAIDLENGAIDENIKKIKELNQVKLQEFIDANEAIAESNKKLLGEIKFGSPDIRGITAGGTPLSSLIVNAEEETLTLKEYIDSLEELRRKVNSGEYFIPEGFKKVDIIKLLNDEINKQTEAYDALNNPIIQVIAAIEKLNGVQSETPDGTDDGTDALYDYTTALEETNKAIDDTQSSLKSLSSLYEQVSEGQSLSSDQMLDLIQEYPIVNSLMDAQGNLMVSQQDLLKTLFDLKKNDLALTLKAEKEKSDAVINSLDTQRTAYLGFYKAIGATLGYSEEQAATMFGFDKESYDKAVKASADLQAKINALDKLTFKDYSSKKKSTSTSDYNQDYAKELTEPIDILDNRIQNLTNEYKMLQEQGASVVEQNKKIDEIIDTQIEKQSALIKLQTDIKSKQSSLASSIQGLSNKQTIDLSKATEDEREAFFNTLSKENKKKFNEWIKDYDGLGKSLASAVNEGFETKFDISKSLKQQLDNSVSDIDSIIKTYFNKNKSIENQLKGLSDDDYVGKTALLNDQISTNNEAIKEYDRSIQSLIDQYGSSMSASKDYADTLESLRNKKQELVDKNAELIQTEKGWAEKLASDVIKTQKEIDQTNLKSFKDASDARIDSYQREIDALQEKNDLITEQEERAEHLLNIQKAQVALQDAQNNKNTKILRQNDEGQYYWSLEADPKKVQEAQDQLKKVQEDYTNWERNVNLKKQKKYWEDLIDQEKASQKTREDEFNKHYENMDLLTTAYFDNLKTMYGSKWDEIIAVQKSKLAELESMQNIKIDTTVSDNLVSDKKSELQAELAEKQAEKAQILKDIKGKSDAENMPKIIKNAQLSREIAELEKKIAKFDTGGLTGTFDGGKLAVLHEKELVLNKIDTSNLLKVIDITRQLVGKIKMPNFSNLATAGASPSGSSIVYNVNIDKVVSPDGQAFVNSLKRMITIK